MLLDLLYPPVCIFCGEILGGKSYEKKSKTLFPDMLCPACRKTYPPIKEPVCMKCGKRLETELEEYCFDCEKKEFTFHRNCSIYPYEERIRDAMHNLKYKNAKRNGEFFGIEMARQLGEWILSLEVETLIPIPLHKKRQRLRGYNQSEVIARALSRQLGIPVVGDVLIRQEDTKPQKELSQKERKINVKNAFKISKNDIQYGKVLLIDDIYTTGATLEAAAQVLRKSGVDDVYCATACIGRGY